MSQDLSPPNRVLSYLTTDGGTNSDLRKRTESAPTPHRDTLPYLRPMRVTEWVLTLVP
jgi:hypothetical protein